MILNEWTRVPIKEIYSGLYDGPHATPKQANEGAIFLGIKNITEDGRLDLSEIRWISDQDFPKWTRRVTPQKNDIVFSYEATLHRYALIPENFHGCLGRRLALIRPNLEKIIPRFLFYYFFSDEWKSTIAQNLIFGATVERIPLINFPEFEIDLPPLPTQRKIAAILSRYDDMIENNTRRIAILEEMAQTLYREWFVHFRFPGHESVRLVESELGLVPEGWEVKPFSKPVTINPKMQVDRKLEKPYVEMANLSTNSMVVECHKSREGSTGSKFKNQDTLFPRITPSVENGKRGFVQFLKTDQIALGSTEFIVMRSTTLCPEFVYLATVQSDFRDHAAKSMVGASGRQRVQYECFDSYYIAHPPSNLMAKFQQTVAPMFQTTQKLADKNATLRQTRDMLLPKLISGEVDVAELEINL